MEVVVLLLVPIVIVLLERLELLELLELLEEANIPPTPIMIAAARTIAMIITAMIILPIAGLSSNIDRSCLIFARRFSCNIVIPDT